MFDEQWSGGEPGGELGEGCFRARAERGGGCNLNSEGVISDGVERGGTKETEVTKPLPQARPIPFPSLRFVWELGTLFSNIVVAVQGRPKEEVRLTGDGARPLYRSRDGLRCLFNVTEKGYGEIV